MALGDFRHEYVIGGCNIPYTIGLTTTPIFNSKENKVDFSEERIKKLEADIKNLNGKIHVLTESIKHNTDIIHKLIEHKHRQIDENRCISRNFDEINNIILGLKKVFECCEFEERE